MSDIIIQNDGSKLFRTPGGREYLPLTCVNHSTNLWLCVRASKIVRTKYTVWHLHENAWGDWVLDLDEDAQVLNWFGCSECPWGNKVQVKSHDLAKIRHLIRRLNAFL